MGIEERPKLKGVKYDVIIIDEFKDIQMHPSTEAILKFFEYEHLPVHLQDISKDISLIAWQMAEKLEGPELTAGLRKLLEAKDCFVRAAL